MQISIKREEANPLIPASHFIPGVLYERDGEIKFQIYILNGSEVIIIDTGTGTIQTATIYNLGGLFIKCPRGTELTIRQTD